MMKRVVGPRLLYKSGGAVSLPSTGCHGAGAYFLQIVSAFRISEIDDWLGVASYYRSIVSIYEGMLLSPLHPLITINTTEGMVIPSIYHPTQRFLMPSLFYALVSAIRSRFIQRSEER